MALRTTPGPWQTADVDEGITVPGFGAVAVPADRLSLRLRLACAGAGVAEALSALTARTDAVMQAITDQCVDRYDVQNSGLYIEP